MPQARSAAEYGPLMHAASPDVYRKNSFRTLGINVDTSPAELRRRVQRLEMMERLGTKAQMDRAALPLPEMATLDRLLAAQQRLEDPEARLVDELFWFWPGDGTDSTRDLALEALRRNDFQTARDIWVKRQVEGDSTATHNLAVFYHLRALEVEATARPSAGPETGVSLWRMAWSFWQGLVVEERFWLRLQRRAAELDDPRLPAGVAGSLRVSLLPALARINARLAAETAEKGAEVRATLHASLVRQAGISEMRAVALLEAALNPVRRRITQSCERASADTEKSADRTQEVLRHLLDEARQPLAALNCLLGAGNAFRDGAHDEIAGLVRARLVTYGNQSNDWKTCEELLERISLLAVSTSLRTRIDDDLKTVRSNRSQQLCWFCGENEPTKWAAPTLQMHGNVQRSGQGTSWKCLPVPIPRCRRCFRIHWARKLGWAVALTIAAGCVSWPLDSSGLQALIATVAAGIGVLLGSRMAWPGKLRTVRGEVRAVAREADKHQHPFASALLDEGWVPGRRPSGTSMQVTPAGAVWAAIGIGVFVLLVWVFASLRYTTSGRELLSRPVQLPQSSTPRASNLAVLKVEIEAGRTALRGLESDLRNCKQTLDYYDSLGDVESYNAELVLCRQVYSEYERQLADTNSKIDEHNRLIRTR